jgi:hypothetical protein
MPSNMDLAHFEVVLVSGVEIFAELTTGKRHEPIMPHDLAHNSSILLFYITLIAFQIRASSRKGDLSTGGKMDSIGARDYNNLIRLPGENWEPCCTSNKGNVSGVNGTLPRAI